MQDRVSVDKKTRAAKRGGTGIGSQAHDNRTFLGIGVRIADRPKTFWDWPHVLNSLRRWIVFPEREAGVASADQVTEPVHDLTSTLRVRPHGRIIA